MHDVVARNLRDPVYHLKHSRNDRRQEICLFTDNFIRNSVCERQNVIQPAQKIRWYLFILVLHLHELDGQALPPLLIRQ